MTFTRMYSKGMMSSGASAPCANAASSCAQTAPMQSANTVALIMDATLVASIIIFALISLLVLVNLLNLVSLILVALLVVVLVKVHFYTPRTRASV